MVSISEIQSYLASEDPQLRMRGITALQPYAADVAVPLLLTRQSDEEVVVRSFVAMGLGYKRNDEAFTTLVSMLTTEKDNNVRSEVANSLTKYGQIAIPHIVPAFYTYPDWLMRMSILLALADMDAPHELFQLCLAAIVDPDATVRETGVKCLAFLADSDVAEHSLQQLLEFTQSSSWQMRQQAAIALRKYLPDSRAVDALATLQQDEDYRVVSVVLDGIWAT